MTRVWLTQWEWACCGDPFGLGDDVDFGIASRSSSPRLTEALGAELADRVDAIESHHEEEFSDRVRGRVSAVHAVSSQFVERRVLRRPGRGAPADAVMPADGEEWPAQGRDLGNGYWIGSRPTRYVIESTPALATARLEPVHGVRQGSGEPAAPASDPAADPPEERLVWNLVGWLVDVDEN